MFRNVAGQEINVFAFTPLTGLPKTGDAANLTLALKKDTGSAADLADTSASEIDATKMPGWYKFSLAQADTNAHALLFAGRSVTSGVVVVGIPAIFTVAANADLLSVDGSGRVTLAALPTISANWLTANGLAADAVTKIVAGVFGRLFSAGFLNKTFDEMIKIIAAPIAGHVTGAGTSNPAFKDFAGTSTVVTGTDDASGNRSGMSYTPS